MLTLCMSKGSPFSIFHSGLALDCCRGRALIPWLHSSLLRDLLGPFMFILSLHKGVVFSQVRYSTV